MDTNSTQLAAIVADTNELQTNQGNWLTATGFATSTALTTAQNDLDKITGVDGATLATAQALYAPAKASDIVTSGAINTLGGAVSTVSTVADSVGQSADNDAKLTTLLARIVGTLAAGTHNPATAAQIAVLSDWIDGGRLDSLLDAVPASTSTAVWSDTLTTYTDGQAGKRVKGITAVPVLEGAVNDVSATSTVIKTTLTGYGDTFFDDALILIELSTDSWQGRPVTGYSSITGEFTVDEPFLSAPANGVAIAVQATHIHSVTEIKTAVTSDMDANSTKLASIDGVKAKTDQLAFTVANQVDSNAKSMNDAAITGTGTDVDPWS
jgi:hypothetical protein